MTCAIAIRTFVHDTGFMAQPSGRVIFRKFAGTFAPFTVPDCHDSHGPSPVLSHLLMSMWQTSSLFPTGPLQHLQCQLPRPAYSRTWPLSEIFVFMWLSSCSRRVPFRNCSILNNNRISCRCIQPRSRSRRILHRVSVPGRRTNTFHRCHRGHDISGNRSCYGLPPS